MKTLFALLLVVASSSISLAQDVVAWRRDGTGIFPHTDPPTHWQQISKAVGALRCQVAAPEGDAASGTPMPDGVVREWLILGPVTDPGGKKGAADPVFAEDQSTLAPVAGARLADAQWKPLHAQTSYIDFGDMFGSYGKTVNHAAYAYTRIYSPADASFIASINHSESVTVWLNGKLLGKPTDTDFNFGAPPLNLRKGWNTLLIRSTPKQASAPPIPGTWYVSMTLRAAKPELQTRGIRWKTALPAGEGFGGPIVTGGRIFVQSEPADLVCIEAATGKILWVRSNNYDQLATDAEKQSQPALFAEIAPLQQKLKIVNDSFATANPPPIQKAGGREGSKEKIDLESQLYKLMRQVDDKKYKMPKGQDVGYSGFTPITDGKHVWSWFATGVTCCYDLQGTLVWSRLDNEGSFWEHGYSASPILADGKVLVTMNKVIAIDAHTGERLWTAMEQPTPQYHGTPASAILDKTPIAILPSGQFLRLSDGKLLHNKGPESDWQAIPSPVVIGDTVFELNKSLHKVALPGKLSDPMNPVSVNSCKIDVSHYPTYYFDCFLASPLIYEGLAYCLNNSGVLVVVDVATMQVLYQQLVDLDAFQNSNEAAGRGVGISPSAAGGKIYIFGDAGGSLVIQPGRTYQQIAKNKIESLVFRNWQTRTERFVAAPTFDANCIFLRGERYLYCIAE